MSGCAALLRVVMNRLQRRLELVNVDTLCLSAGWDHVRRRQSSLLPWPVNRVLPRTRRKVVRGQITSNIDDHTGSICGVGFAPWADNLLGVIIARRADDD